MKYTESEIKRFENYIYHSIDGCHYWLSALDKDGYGKLQIGRSPKRAHRISYELYKGEIKSGLYVCHTCDNPMCVNPDHLFLGTALDNNRDKMRKNRFVFYCSENHACSKLTNDQVLKIRSLAGLMSHQAIGDMFNVHRVTITHIISRRNWKNI